MKTIQVVAAILMDAQGRVLINQRPSGKSWSGYWEFPGGKLETGETPIAALTRELHEELGLAVQKAQHWMHLNHDYPEYRVALQVWRVLSYTGKPQARENQALAWTYPAELASRNLLPADAPIVKAICLPPLMLVTPMPGANRVDFLRTLENTLSNGVNFVQLRTPGLSHSEYVSLARAVVTICRRHAARLVLNSDPDVARDVGADGVHLSNARLQLISGRPLPEEFLVGASCHDEAGVHTAEAHGMDYIILGPVLPTPSHPEATILGWDRFKCLVSQTRLPTYAIGGMQPGQLEYIRGLGGHGVAAIRGLWGGQQSEPP